MRLILILIINLLVAGAAPAAFAQGKTAQVSALEGTATKARGSARPAPLKAGAGLAQGDIVETGDDSRMEIRFSDASVLRMGSKAKLQLTEAHFGNGPAKRRMTARLFFGNLWAKVTSVVQ